MFAILVSGGFYTGLADGRIVQIGKNEVTEVVARIGKPPCGELKRR